MDARFRHSDRFAGFKSPTWQFGRLDRPAPSLAAETSDIYLAALERIQRRGRAGTITQALADIAEAFAATDALDLAMAGIEPAPTPG